MVLGVELEQPLQLIVMLGAAHEHSAAPSARSLLLAPYAVQAEYWLFKQKIYFTREGCLMSPVYICPYKD